MLSAIALLGLLSAPSAAADGDMDYRLGPGDMVQVGVYGQPEITQTALVTGSCRIELRFIGAVEVCGLTTAEVAAEAARQYRDEEYFVDPIVDVTITVYGSQKVNVIGAAKKPGLQVITGPTLLSEVISIGGGPADPSVVDAEVIKTDGTTTTYSLSQIPVMVDPVWVEAGDVVVLKTGRLVYVQGQVRNQGAVPYSEGLTASQALLRAGGANEYASRRRAYILRADGTKVPVNFKKIADGRAADVAVQPDDQLILRQSIL